MTPDPILTSQISDWLNTSPKQRSLEDGALLLLRLNANRIMYQMILRNRLSEKLEYELQKHLNIRLHGLTRAEVAKVERQVMPRLKKELANGEEYRGRRADHDSLPDKVKALYDLAGDTLVVTENLVGPGMMMASCGIAYVMRYIRAQMEGGCEMGFYPAQAKQIALQTMQGAVSLLKETGWHPEEAIDKVTTPGGVTIKGLNELDHAGFNSAVIRSLKAGLKK